MSDATPPAGPLRLEQLVALNDELEALVRAGIPLERGLAAAGRDHRGRLGRAIRELGARLDAGEPLPEAMAHAAAGMPAAYGSIIEAGIRSNRLAEALQGMARIGQALLDARRTVALASFYPILVVSLAYGLFLFYVMAVIPRFVAAAASLRIEGAWLVAMLDRAGRSAPVWGPIAPLVLVGLLLAWHGLGRAGAVDGPGRLVPWVGRIVGNYRVAHFAELLAHLVDHGVPLDRSVRLAADAAGAGASFRRSADRLADGLAAGDPVPAGAPALGSFPPLVAWMLTSGGRGGELAAGLRHLAGSYRRKADRQAEAFRAFLPGFLVVAIGAVAVLLYGVLLFAPLRGLWEGLATPA